MMNKIRLVWMTAAMFGMMFAVGVSHGETLKEAVQNMVELTDALTLFGLTMSYADWMTAISFALAIVSFITLTALRAYRTFRKK